jgi:hypothetical protein
MRLQPQWGCRATRLPYHLAGDGLLAYLARGHDISSVPARTRLLERIPSALTLGGDLGKQRSAQR